MYAFIGAFFPLAFIAVCLRLYSRWKFNHVGKDDVAIVVAFVRRTPALPTRDGAA